MECSGMARKSSFSRLPQPPRQKARKFSVCAVVKWVYDYRCYYSFFFFRAAEHVLPQLRAGLRLAQPPIGLLNMNAAIKTCQQPRW